ncbi:hypothetical protein BH11PLA2_BH11PLA2_29880 [soil metagenome]
MSEIRFSFEEMNREVLDFYGFAKPFLDPSAEGCLTGFAAKLSTIRTKGAFTNATVAQRNRNYPWAITGNHPLLTKPSRSYEKGKKQKGREVVGRLTAIWEITPDPKQNIHDVPKQMRLTGNASVLVEWIDAASHKTLGQWNVDVADIEAPGCMFHAQFPSGIPVPRLPIMAFTPMAVAEHVLGELFQDEWEKHSLGQSAHMESWASIQNKRLTRLLSWHREILEGCTYPPWTALKKERIPEDRFVKT